MNVLVDTNVWTLAVRRRRGGLTAEEKAIVLELTELIRDDRILMIGPVRQELLSGIRTTAEFQRLQTRLSDFLDEPLETADFEEAAGCYNRCRTGGVAGSLNDFLICAVAIRRGASIFTSDVDFELYSQHIPINIHRLPGGNSTHPANI